MLAALKQRPEVQITSTAYDGNLTQLLASASGFISREGATLDTTGSAEDAQLVIWYAAWMYAQSAGKADDTMPRGLRWALNNRIFSEAIQS